MFVDKNKKRRELYAVKSKEEKLKLSNISVCNRRLRREKLRIIMNKFKIERGGKCQLCGYNKNLVALVWHHVDDKEYTIADLMSKAQINKVIKEIQKCTLVCANCHMILHNE